MLPRAHLHLVVGWEVCIHMLRFKSDVLGQCTCIWQLLVLQVRMLSPNDEAHDDDSSAL